MVRLSSDTKAVLRELRRHDRELELQISRLVTAIVEASFALIEAGEDAKTELVIRRRSPTPDLGEGA